MKTIGFCFFNVRRNSKARKWCVLGTTLSATSKIPNTFIGLFNANENTDVSFY